jgi:hypothetical protein
MDLRQTAVNTLSYQLDRAPKPRRAERRQTGPEPRSANVLAAPGPAAGPGEPPGRGRIASCNYFISRSG